MTQYTLNIAIDDNGLDKIANSGKRVTLVKSVGGTPSRSQVVWVTFDAGENTIVEWEEDYFIYATKTSQQAGATIRMTSSTHDPVTDNTLYTFTKGHFRSGPGGSSGVFTVADEQDDDSTMPFNFGLAQIAKIDGTSVLAPLNMVSADKGDQITFEPIETVSIYLSKVDDNGVVISNVDSKALAIEFTSSDNVKTVHLNDADDTFHLGALPAAA